MSLYSRPMPMGDIQQMLMGLPSFKNKPSRVGFTGVLEGKEGVDIDPDFFQSDFYKTYNDPKYTSGYHTMDIRPSQYFDVGGDQRFLDSAYNRFLKARDSGEPVQISDPITPPPSNQNPFMGGSSYTPSPFRGGPSLIGGGFGGFGGFGRSPFMGGFGGFGRSPFGGLGMFGMSPYGGYGGYGMFGGMMNPFMGMGGFGQMQPYRGSLPFERRMRFPQQPQQLAADRSTFVTDPTNFGTNPGTGLSTPSTQPTYYQGSAFTPSFQLPSQPPQQSTQGGNYMGPNMNNSFMQMQNPFMSGLGSMFGNMFGGGYGSNVSNTQANVAQ